MATAAADPAVTGIDIGPATARLQAIYAPDACKGGAGTCFTAADAAPGAQAGVFPAAGGLAEDLLLEYGDGKPMGDVGWGRASAADIADQLGGTAAAARVRLTRACARVQEQLGLTE